MNSEIRNAREELRRSHERFEHAMDLLRDKVAVGSETIRHPGGFVKGFVGSHTQGITSKFSGGYETARTSLVRYRDLGVSGVNENPLLAGAMVFLGALGAGFLLSGRKKKVDEVALAEFIDRCTARWYFEKTGVQLYTEAIAKSPIPIRERLEEIRREEKEHEEMLEDVLRAYGADPHIMTPAARIVRTESIGIVTVAENENFRGTIDALLAAELVDNASWELLVKLAKRIGDPVAEKRFRKALLQEMTHLKFIRELIVDDALAKMKRA